MTLLAVLVTTLMVSGISATENRDGKVCNTNSCQVAATDILSCMDKKVDPCQDFYKFACGGFISKNQPTASKPINIKASSIIANLEKEKSNILEKPKNYADFDIINKMKDDFAACKHVTKIEKEGYKFLLDNVVNNNKFGGWEMIIGSQSDGSKYSFGGLDGYNVQSGIFTHLLPSGVVRDNLNTSQHIVKFDQGNFLYLQGNMYLNQTKYKSKIDAVKTLINDLIKLYARKANKNVEDQKLKQFQTEVIQFETEVAKLMKPPIRSVRNETVFYNPTTLKKIVASYPYLNLKKYFTEMFQGTKYTPTDQTPVTISDPEFYDKFNHLIGRTSKKFLANYQFLKMSQSFAEVGPKELMDIQLKYDSAIKGITAKKDRKRVCIRRSTTRAFKFALAIAYVQEKSSYNTKDQVDIISNQVKEALTDIITGQQWMDDQTRHLVREKFDWMLLMTSYPNWMLDQDKVDKYYRGFPYDAKNNYLDNLYNTIRWESKKYLQKMAEPVKRDEWFYTPLSFKSYNAYRNTIAIPAGILQNPLYLEGAPKYINMGSFGTLLGINMDEAVYGTGEQFGKTGNLQNIISEQSAQSFNKTSQCFVDKYNKYKIPELKDILGADAHVNGARTLDSNLADSAGLAASFKAYKKFSKDISEESLPGLENYSNDKLFFISAARTFCASMSKAILASWVKFGTQSPPAYRVLGAFSTNQDFANAFQCSKDAPYNGKEQCPL